MLGEAVALILLFPGLSLLILAYAFAINIMLIGLFMIFEPSIDNQNKHAVLTVVLGLLTVGLLLLWLVRQI